MPLDSAYGAHCGDAVMPRVHEQIHTVEHRSTLVGFDFFGFRGKLRAHMEERIAAMQPAQAGQ